MKKTLSIVNLLSADYYSGIYNYLDYPSKPWSIPLVLLVVQEVSDSLGKKL